MPKSLSRHIKTAHYRIDSITYCCVKCGKQFSQKCNCSRHEQICGQDEKERGQTKKTQQTKAKNPNIVKSKKFKYSKCKTCNSIFYVAKHMNQHSSENVGVKLKIRMY